jgi:integrase
VAFIEKLKDGYRVGWREGGRDAPRRYRPAPDKRTADALKRRIEHDLALHGRVTIDDRPDAPPALHARLDAWIDSLVLSLKPRTASGYGDACALFLRYLVDKRLTEQGKPLTDEALRQTTAEALPVSLLDRDALVGWQAWLIANGRAISTVAKRAQALRIAWEWLFQGPDQRWLSPPPSRIATRKRRRPKVIAPTWAECDAALQACYEHDPRAAWLYVFALFARYTGLRRSELLLLEWTDLHPDGTLLIRTETTKGEISGRRIPLAPGLLAELARLPCEGRYIIPAPEGERIAAAGDGRGHVDRSMRRAWTRAGVAPEKWKGQPCHAFRKTIETEGTLLGIRREVVDYLLGHQPEGVGPRHYMEQERALWPELVAAVKKFPDPPRRPAASNVVPLRTV